MSTAKKNQTEPYNEFNTLICQIFKILKSIKADKLKGKLYLNELHDKVNKLIRADSSAPIKEIGPMVYEARKEILAEDMKYFINKEYVEGLQEFGNRHDWNKHDLADATEAINYIKSTAVMANIDQRNELFSVSQSMLTTYVNYLISIKQVQT